MAVVKRALLRRYRYQSVIQCSLLHFSTGNAALGYSRNQSLSYLKSHHPVLNRLKVNNGDVKLPCRLHSTAYISPYNFEEAYDIHDGSREGPIILPNNEAEYLIIGGGAMGLSLAFHLWRNLESITPLKASKHIKPTIVVVERDPAMKKAATPRAVGGIRQQFSNPSNVKLAMKSAEYLRNIKYHLGTAGHNLPNIQFTPQGYLFLATVDGADQLMENYATQKDVGAKVMLLTQNKLKELFPWMNTEGIELASYGLENEGWFDPWALTEALKVKLKSFDIRYIKGDVVGFKKKVDEARHSSAIMPDGSSARLEEFLSGVYVQLPDVDKAVYVKTRAICNCAGPWSKEIAEMLGVGINESSCSHPVVQTPLPIEPRKRWVYTVHCPGGPIFDCPLVVDPSGCYVRRDGFNGHYVCGMSPENDDAVDHSNLDIDYDFFYEEVWPRLAHRIPAFENLKLTSAWAGYYEFNTFDCNGVIGNHPYYRNFSFLTGFSGHGVQMAMGAAACLAEMLVTGPDELLEEIDIKPLGFSRFVLSRPLLEANIV